MKLAIFCAGSLGKEILSIILHEENKYKEIIFIDDIINEKYMCDKRVYKFEEFLACFSKDQVEVVIATGEPVFRKKLFNLVKEKGYHLAKIISNKSFVANNTKIEEGVVIFPNCYIGENAIIHSNTILHAGANIVGEVEIGSHNFVSIGVFVGDSTFVDDCVFIGPNASVADNIIINKNSIIGIGAVVIKDIDECSVNAGVPSKIIRRNDNGRVFR